MTDCFVLSYDSGRIYESDVTSLRDQNYINDAIMSFYFYKLEKRESHAGKLLILRPAVVRCFASLPRPASYEFAQEIPLGTAEAIAIPLNNAMTDSSTHSQGMSGSHWSLLVYLKMEDPIFLHFDSSESKLNQKTAISVVRKLSSVMHDRPVRFLPMPSTIDVTGAHCGVYVLLLTGRIYSYFAEGGKTLDDLRKNLHRFALRISSKACADFRKALETEIRMMQSSPPMTR